MHSFTLLFLTFLALSLGVRVWLARRQMRSVEAHRGAVPRAFADKISLQDHQKAADYTVANLRFGRIELLVTTGYLLAWTLGGGLQWLDDAWQATTLAPIYAGTAFIISFMLIMALLELPLSAWHTFGIEQRFGFNRTSAGLFVLDHLKQVALLLLIGIPLVLLVLWLMQNAGRMWWLYVWGVWMVFGVLMMLAYPVLIAPLFNKFSPLTDTELKQRIERLLGRCGFASKGVFVMDGSRRSVHGNAYFTGLGRSKRIVFFDTLIESLEPGEIEAVLAHELGHYRHRHVHKNLLQMAALTLAGLAVLGWLIEQPWFYTALGVETPSVHAALVLFILVAPVFAFFLRPILSWLMRRHEFEADDFAARQADAKDLIGALVKLYSENASTLTPDPVYSAYYDSHPPAPVRVAHLSSKIPR